MTEAKGPRVVARVPRFKQVSYWVRFSLRMLLGNSTYQHCGHFVESEMSRIVHDYWDWVQYPKGNREMDDHPDWVMAVQISEDGTHMYTASYDYTIIHWDLTQEQGLIHRWTAHDGWILALALHFEVLASGGTDSSIRLWSAETHGLLMELDGHSNIVNTLTFDQSGQRLFSGSDDNMILVWSVVNGECLGKLSAHSSYVMSLVCNGNELISASFDQSIRVWNTKRLDNNEHKYLDILSDQVSDLSINCDGSLLACVCRRIIVVLEWPFDFESEEDNRYRMQETSLSVEFHPNEPDQLAVGCFDGSIKLYNVRNEQMMREIMEPNEEESDYIQQVSFTPDGFRLVSVGRDNMVRVFDLSSEK